jgi:hypothetical protein
MTNVLSAGVAESTSGCRMRYAVSRDLVEICHQRSSRFWPTSSILLRLRANNVNGYNVNGYERGGIRCSCQR